MAISESKKKIVIDNYFKRECDINTSIKEAFIKGFELGLEKAPTPQPKIGRWMLTQRDRYVDISCPECGNTRIKDYACGYTIDELDIKEVNDLLAKTRMNYCECCGSKMQEVEG
jgi:transposase